MARRSWLGLVFVVAMVATSCGGSSGGATRTILVDFAHDEFAGGFIGYFPKSVTLRPGDTVDFRQAWNGEPHSVTMGTLVDGAMKVVKPLLAKYPFGEGAPPEAEDTFNTAFLQSQYTHALNDDVSLSFGVQYTDQRSVGSELLGSFQTWTVGARATIDFYGASIGPAFHRTGSGNDIQTPFDPHAHAAMHGVQRCLF